MVMPNISNAGRTTDEAKITQSNALPVAVAATPTASCKTNVRAMRTSGLPAGIFCRRLHRCVEAITTHTTAKIAHVAIRRAVIA
jgi:hypothetical protein